MLGPLVTDVAPGYDHITAAIGGAVAAAAGGVLPLLRDAGGAPAPAGRGGCEGGNHRLQDRGPRADIAKGVRGARDWDDRMSLARKKLDWEAMFDLSMDPEKARAYRASAKPEKEDTCSMCGNFCAVKNMNRILDGEIVSIFDE